MQDRSPPTRRNLLATHGRTIHLGQKRTLELGRGMSALCGMFNRSTQHLLILLEEEVLRWRGLHGYDSCRSRGLSFGSAGRTVNVWRISLGRLRGGTRAVSIVSWLSTVALLRSRAGELRER